mgnify:CR=1 FL=1
MRPWWPAKLGTPEALKGIYEAVSDESPEVRIQAAAVVGEGAAA